MFVDYLHKTLKMRTINLRLYTFYTFSFDNQTKKRTFAPDFRNRFYTLLYLWH